MNPLVRASTLLPRLVHRVAELLREGVALSADDPRNRYAPQSGMIKLRLARSAALAEAARRSLHGGGSW